MTLDRTNNHEQIQDLSQIKHDVSIGLNENTQGLIDQQDFIQIDEYSTQPRGKLNKSYAPP